MAGQMQVADRKTIRKWYQQVEDGVPEDKAMDRLRNEATSANAPNKYTSSWNDHKDLVTIGTVLTKAEIIVVRIYTDDKHKFYWKFNEDCRNSKWENYIVFTSLLQSAVCKLRRKHAENTVEFSRGVHAEAKHVKADEIIFMPCFTSTSLSPETSGKFGATTIVFQTSTCGAITDISVFPGEKETLIPPFQCFTVVQNSSRLVLKSSIEMTCPFLASPLIRGALLGAVVGNSIGSPYEFQNPVTLKEIVQNLNKLESDDTNRGRSRYTVDTCMTLALANSLTKVERLDMEDLRECFVQTLFNDPDRNYGESVINVLTELRGHTKDGDLYAPAKRLFGGKGSMGNGGAMRIAPLAIYYFFERENQFNTYVKSVTALTHNHLIAINGAILQADAVQYALISSVYGGRSDDFAGVYVDELIKTMGSIEFLNRPFCKKLEKIKIYLKTPPTDETIRAELGNGITADTSVPTAIYCFLRGIKPIPGIPPDRTEFERTIIYAISLGGDTDTIASMAGAIAGAYYGQDSVTQRWRDLCEPKAIEDAKLYANKMIGQLFWDGDC